MMLARSAPSMGSVEIFFDAQSECFGVLWEGVEGVSPLVVGERDAPLELEGVVIWWSV